MQVVILYTLSVLIWGSTWAAIRFQLGPVAEEVSVAYRFAIASLALFAYGLASRRPLRIPLQRYPMVVVQGVVLFSINYLLVYYGTNFITTGLVAVVFSLIVLSNAFFDRMFFGTPLESRLLLASIMGISGNLKTMALPELLPDWLRRQFVRLRPHNHLSLTHPSDEPEDSVPYIFFFCHFIKIAQYIVMVIKLCDHDPSGTSYLVFHNASQTTLVV